MSALKDGEAVLAAGIVHYIPVAANWTGVSFLNGDTAVCNTVIPLSKVVETLKRARETTEISRLRALRLEPLHAETYRQEIAAIDDLLKQLEK